MGGGSPAQLPAGGRELDIGIGIGPPRTHTAAEVRVIAAALAQVDDAELRRRFAPAEMMRLEIYPDIWDRDPVKEDPLGYLLESVAGLRRGLERVVERGHGMLVMHT